MRHRQSFCLLAMLALLGTAIAGAHAADAPAPTPHAINKPPRHAQKPTGHAPASARAADSEAARREREHRDDLERRVERLEQEQEMKQPSAPPAVPARP